MDTKVRTKRTDLIYPELSYDIVGALFKVFSAVGAGHKEAVYQRTTALALQDAQVSFKEQVYLPLLFKKEIVGKYFLDFLIEDKIILELKVRNYFSLSDIKQVIRYLKTYKLKLGILAHFTKDGVRYKRILNLS